MSSSVGDEVEPSVFVLGNEDALAEKIAASIQQVIDERDGGTVAYLIIEEPAGPFVQLEIDGDDLLIEAANPDAVGLSEETHGALQAAGWDRPDDAPPPLWTDGTPRPYWVTATVRDIPAVARLMAATLCGVFGVALPSLIQFTSWQQDPLTLDELAEALAGLDGDTEDDR